MPRQDVPYGGAICRLKERLAEIWDKLGEKLHSVNGVTGDAAGNVEIVSGDAAITISEDQVNHQITIGLDQAELPAAAVSSVNGQTGAVVLDAGDINVLGGSDVQTELDDLDADVQQAQTDIAQEALARANADSALQGNINTVQASIPGAAATAVANDPTVAQLAVDVPNKVDKITSGSTKRAYTHTGAVQDDTPVVNGSDANSIGLRDANGRMYAADPASGATDRSLVTANWASQTGNDAPSNLLHKTGAEKITGLITSEQSLLADILGVPCGRPLGYYKTHNLGTAATSGGWYLNILFNYRYGIRLLHMEIVFTNGLISNITATNYIGTEPVGNTAVTADIIDDNVYLVIHRKGQNNVYSRVNILFIQKGTASAAIPTRLDEAEYYTPAETLIEVDII